MEMTMTNQMKALEERENSIRMRSETSMLDQLDTSSIVTNNAEAMLSSDLRYVSILRDGKTTKIKLLNPPELNISR
jgi:hypothetical protein